MKRLGSAMGSVNTILHLARICVAGFVLALWFVPCVVCAQGVKSPQHRAGLSGGLGLLYVGIDDDGGTEDMGGAASIGVSYGYVATEDFEIGGIATYWNSNAAAVEHAFSIAARARGILSFADGAGEVGLELQCGYLAIVIPTIYDVSIRDYRTHLFNGFGVTATIDGGLWVSDRIGIFAGPTVTAGLTRDSSSDKRSYLPENSHLVAPGATATLRARF